MIKFDVDTDIVEYARWVVVDTAKMLAGVVMVYGVLLGVYWGGVGVFANL